MTLWISTPLLWPSLILVASVQPATRRNRRKARNTTWKLWSNGIRSSIQTRKCASRAKPARTKRATPRGFNIKRTRKERGERARSRGEGQSIESFNLQNKPRCWVGWDRILDPGREEARARANGFRQFPETVMRMREGFGKDTEELSVLRVGKKLEHMSKVAASENQLWECMGPSLAEPAGWGGGGEQALPRLPKAGSNRRQSGGAMISRS
ncbi:hypothetical protein FB45DRAFT_876648 [Roridomyces roridus]|uniref:Uncharacterized protein n=1 Tax=Roridomyces roridus TaxID=1738132 RepID=A0AAD7FB12_9AGAR|nr:hypothetical protein FB45DRAFT_876648 [Roridomyces roridus]